MVVTRTPKRAAATSAEPSPSRRKRGPRVGAPPGPRKRDLRLGELLDAAAALIVEKGLGATSIDDIAARAGVAKGTFYHYFADRGAMLEALRLRYTQRFGDAAVSAIAACPEGDWAARLDAWIAATIRQYFVTYPLHDAIFHEPAVCQRHEMSAEPIVMALANLLRDGAAAGVWSVSDAAQTATFMFYGLHGALDEAILRGEDGEAIAPFVSNVLHAMVRHAP